MRPRRRVALYSYDQQSAGVAAYLLRLRLNLEVECCATATQLAVAGCELFILILTASREKVQFRELCACLPGPSLLYDPQALLPEAECSATFYLQGPIKAERLLDCVRIMLVRRRGPKPADRFVRLSPHADSTQ